MSDRLMAQLDGAEMIVYDADGFVLAWYGGESTGIHIYNGSGEEVDYFQMGARSTGSYTSHEARTAMREHIAGMDDDDDDDDDDAAPSATDDALEAKARELGLAAGYSAGSWYFDGNTDEATYRRALEGIDAGDPAVYGTFPSSPLSGEWADGPTPATLAADLGISADDERMDDVCRAYEDAFSEAVEQEISERAAYILSDDAKAR